MGTRGAVGFRSGRKDKVQYNHSDSYPSYLGRHVLEFIQGSSLESLKDIASRIELVDEDAAPTGQQIQECMPYADTSVGGQTLKDWYCLLRGAQGNLDA